MLTVPYLGHGIGLRTVHHAEIRERCQRPRRSRSGDLQWLEIISENFFERGGAPRRMLRDLRGHLPLVMHGVSLSIGSVDPLDDDYLKSLSALAGEIQPVWLSDHLCWGGVNGQRAHDLLPLPYSEEALDHVVDRVIQVQDRLGRQILLENVSSYVQFAQSILSEWEFLAAVAERADCGLLLDVNNIYVSGHNHGFDPRTFIDGMPRGRVGQIHLAGHSQEGDLLIDTHDHAVCDPVWDLYAHAIERHGPVSTLIEWDDQIPSLDRLLEESRRASQIAQRSEGKPLASQGS